MAASLAVAEALKDVDILMERVKAISAERERMFRLLGGFDWIKPFPSSANFIFCFLTGVNALEIKKGLQDRGILVRYFDQPPLENGLRISVGRPEETDRLVEALHRMEER